MDGFKNNADGYTQLEASSLAVGLPKGLMGNSEVGHLNIGAGRVVWQVSFKIYCDTMALIYGYGYGLERKCRELIKTCIIPGCRSN